MTLQNCCACIFLPWYRTQHFQSHFMSIHTDKTYCFICRLTCRTTWFTQCRLGQMRVREKVRILLELCELRYRREEARVESFCCRWRLGQKASEAWQIARKKDYWWIWISKPLAMVTLPLLHLFRSLLFSLSCFSFFAFCPTPS